MKSAVCVVVLLVLSVCLTVSAFAQVGWRNDWTGLHPDENPPIKWSATQNVLWKVPLAPWSNASPVLYRWRIFVAREPSVLVCLRQGDGKVLWEANHEYKDILPSGELGKAGAKPRTHGSNGYSSPTPVCHDDRVYALFGNGVAASYDMEGNRIWARLVGKSTNGWGHSASPVIAGDRLVLHIGSKVYGLDMETGETVWTADSKANWGTPLPVKFWQGGYAVLTTGGEVVRCSDGLIVAKGIGSMPWTSPILHNGIIYIVDQNGAFAYRFPEELTDELQVEKIWQVPAKRDRYYASPIVYQGLLYAITQRGQMTVFNTYNGEVFYQKAYKLGGTYYPSFSLVGNKIFLSSDSGRTVVLDPPPDKELRELSTNQLEGFKTTPAFGNDLIYIRTRNHLFCIGRTGPPAGSVTDTESPVDGMERDEQD